MTEPLELHGSVNNLDENPGSSQSLSPFQSDESMPKSPLRLISLRKTPFLQQPAKAEAPCCATSGS